VVFSQLGQRVLLLDADLRSPTQHALFGLENRSGLSTVLAGRQTAADLERVEGLEHLWVLPSGALPPNPTELLSRPAFARLLDEFKERFDVILVDSPPALRYADAQITAVRATAALLVARKGASRALAARDLAASLQVNTTLVGSVLNDY
jgi:receptor protein-tyrosine kinase